MIEAVIFDFGGVFTSSPFEAFAKYERDRGLPPDIIRKINSTNHENNAWALFERAELDLDGFDKAFAAMPIVRSVASEIATQAGRGSQADRRWPAQRPCRR